MHACTHAQVLIQTARPVFNPRKDYLDALMQFGYVVQFTAAWALSPVPALVNNVIEMRGNVLKMITGHSHAVPRRAR